MRFGKISICPLILQHQDQLSGVIPLVISEYHQRNPVGHVEAGPKIQSQFVAFSHQNVSPGIHRQHIFLTPSPDQVQVEVVNGRPEWDEGLTEEDASGPGSQISDSHQGSVHQVKPGGLKDALALANDRQRGDEGEDDLSRVLPGFVFSLVYDEPGIVFYNQSQILFSVAVKVKARETLNVLPE